MNEEKLKKKYDHVNIVLYGKKPYLKKNPNITFIDNLTSCSDTTCKLQCTRAQILLHCTVLNYVLNWDQIMLNRGLKDWKTKKLLHILQYTIRKFSSLAVERINAYVYAIIDQNRINSN